MRIFMYEVRDDEYEYIDKFSKELNVEIVTSKMVPTPENSDLTKGFDGVSFCGQGNIDKNLLDRFKSYGVSCLSARIIGVNHIDLEYAKKIGFKVCNANYGPDGVSDFTIMLMLMCIRKYNQQYLRSNAGDYTLNGLIGRQLKDMTVGIMGTGNIGCQVIKKLKGFGCRILAYSKSIKDEIVKDVTYVSKEELFANSDIISLHMPFTESTRHIIDESAINLMKDGVIIINCARGELADTQALISGVESKKIGALGLDTVEAEEGIIRFDLRSEILQNRQWGYLHQLKNVIVTPHIAFYTDDAVESMVRCAVEGLYSMYTKGSYITML